jgi:predicted NUDIX family NTP pyrophosphohydrolase
MIKDQSYWIIPVYKNDDWSHEFLIINQKTGNWSFWWLPKWHAEVGEDWIQAAKREFVEEVWISNFKVIEDKYFEINYIFQEKWDKINKTVKYWIAFVKSKDVKIQDAELNWCKRMDFDSAMKILSHENTKNILKKVIQEI